MKGYVAKKLGFRLLFLALSFSILSISASSSILLDFDSLFPSNVYKRALDSCMQLWGEMDAWSCSKSQRRDSDLFSDIIVGKLFYIKTCISEIMPKKCNSYIEDLEYLHEIVDKISLRYKTVFAEQNKDYIKARSIDGLIREIKLKINDLIN